MVHHPVDCHSHRTHHPHVPCKSSLTTRDGNARGRHPSRTLRSSWHLSGGVLLREGRDSHTCQASPRQAHCISQLEAEAPPFIRVHPSVLSPRLRLSPAHIERCNVCHRTAPGTIHYGHGFLTRTNTRTDSLSLHPSPLFPPPPRPSLTHRDRRYPDHPATPPWLRSELTSQCRGADAPADARTHRARGGGQEQSTRTESVEATQS